jgi:hypothetical protein
MDAAIPIGLQRGNEELVGTWQTVQSQKNSDLPNEPTEDSL